MGLGQLPGSTSGSVAGAVSSNGQVVVGGSGVAGDQAFRWTLGEGISGIGFLKGGTTSWAEGVSAGGTFVIGSSTNSSGIIEAFRWSADDGMVGLGALPGGQFSSASAISANGNVVVGQSGNGIGLQAFLWTQSSGMVGLGVLPGAPPSATSEALALTSDGAIVVGQAQNSAGDPVAFIWTLDTGMQPLTSLPGGTETAVSCDVLVRSATNSAGPPIIVGGSSSAESGLELEATLWDSTGTPVGLGDLADGAFSSIAYSVSGDGSVVVGQGTTQLGEEAFIWDAIHGMRNLGAVLSNQYKLDLSGWHLIRAISISQDGLTIAGLALNPRGEPEGWVAYLGTSACPPDLTGDGAVDGADLGLLLGNWGGVGTGDINGDGTVDGADLGVLLGSWGPCP